MKYEIDRMNITGVGLTLTLNLLPESNKEETLLERMENELDGIFGWGNYSLEPVGKVTHPTKHLMGLSYRVICKDPER